MKLRFQMGNTNCIILDEAGNEVGRAYIASVLYFKNKKNSYKPIKIYGPKSKRARKTGK